MKLLHFSIKWLVSTDFPFNIIKVSHPDDQPVHTHDFLELVYVVRGKASHILPSKEYQISGGDFFLLNEKDWHGYRTLTRRGIEIINCLFLPSFIEDAECLKPFYNERRYRIRLPEALRVQARGLLDNMFYELVHKNNGYKQMIKTNLTQLLINMNRIFDRDEKYERLGNLSDVKKQNVAYAIRYIDSNYKKEITLEELAKKTGFTPNYFCGIFKKITGKTVIEYRNEARIKEARQLLSFSTKKITSICFEMGFNDLTYFERVFKKYAGTSPREYRAQFHFSHKIIPKA